MRDEVVTSTANPLVKRLVRLHGRRERDRGGLVPVEGARELGRAVEAGLTLHLLVLAPELYSADAVAAAPALRDAAVETRTFSRSAFARASLRQGPDGVLGLVAPPVHAMSGLGWGSDDHYLVLDGLEKPGNVGALLRTGAAAGIAAAFLCGPGADPWNPNVVRASMGSVFSLPVLTLEPDALRAALRDRGVRVVATSPDAELGLWDADLTGSVAIVVGREHEGLHPEWLAGADVRVSIPMFGAVDSLNAATAGALVLYEAVRQSRRGNRDPQDP